MNYRVDWTASAHDRLEKIWMAAEDNRAVLNAANRIDYLLADNPYRDDAISLGDEPTFIVEPLAVDFEVVENECRVIILDVWMIGHLDQR
jgi:hypothetical protein